MWPPLNIFTILMWLCCGVVPTERMLSCLILGKCRSDSTSPPLPQGVCDLFNDCTMLMWLYTAPTERMFSCLIWFLDNVDLTPTGSMLYCLIPEQCRSDSESACSSSLPQKVCYFWSLDKIDFHHRSHSMYVILLNPCTMSILLHYILVAQTGSMLYCLIPV